MIYSRGLDLWPHNFIPNYWNRKYFQRLSRCTPAEGDIYYYDRHDRHLRGLEFENFIDSPHWALVQQKHATIVIDFADDFFNAQDAERIAKALLDRRIPAEQIYMFVMDPLWTEFARNIFHARGLRIHIAELPWLLYQAVKRFPEPLHPRPDQRTRFSLLSRNYRPWRLELMLNLRAQGFPVDDAQQLSYSFHRHEPYQNITFSHKDLINDARNMGFDVSTAGIKSWIKGVPYDLGSANNKYFMGTYQTIADSHIHILVESHWDPYQTDDIRINEGKDYAPDAWAPSFLTEKFYKTVLCAVPFVVVSTPLFLRDLRKLGYHTFPQLIEEHYDLEMDDRTRSRMIAAELTRISRMDTELLHKLCNNACMAAHRNRIALLKYWRRPVITDQFLYLRRYMHRDQFPPGTWDKEFI